MTINIVIADDHGVLRAGLRSLLKAEPDLEVVGEAADGHEALDLATRSHPDVLIADISMPGPSGIELAQHLQRLSPRTRVLVLTMHEDDCLVQEARRAGAAGYIAKRAVEAELINAIRVVAMGGWYFHGRRSLSPAAQSAPRRIMPNGNGKGLPVTEAEMAVLQLIARGYTSHQVAVELAANAETVERMRLNLNSKLGLNSRIDLIRYAKDQGLIE